MSAAAARHIAHSFGCQLPTLRRAGAGEGRSHLQAIKLDVVAASGRQPPTPAPGRSRRRALCVQCGEEEKAFCAAMAVSGFAAIEVYKMIFYCLSHFHPARARYCGAGPHCGLRNKKEPPARAVLQRYMPDLQHGERRSRRSCRTAHGQQLRGVSSQSRAGPEPAKGTSRPGFPYNGQPTASGETAPNPTPGRRRRTALRARGGRITDNPQHRGVSSQPNAGLEPAKGTVPQPVKEVAERRLFW